MKKDCEERSFFRKEMYLINYSVENNVGSTLMIRHFAGVDFYNQDTVKEI